MNGATAAATGVERAVGEVGGGRSGVGEPVLDEDVRDRGEEEGVAARTDRDVLVGGACGPRADRVDDDEPSAAPARARAGGPGMSGAVIIEPLETSGLAPRMSR